MSTSPLFVDRAGVVRPDLIALAAFLFAEEYGDYARSLILDHAAAGAPLADLTVPTPEGWVVLEPIDLAGAEEALRRGGPAPAGLRVVSDQWSVVSEDRPAPIREDRPAPIRTDHSPLTTDHCEAQPSLAELVAAEAGRLRRSASPIAGFLADQVERIAQLVAFTGARTPGDFVDRLEIHERDVLAREYDRGYADGRDRSAGYCPR